MIDREKRGKTLSEVNPVENISKNLKSFLDPSRMQKEVLLSHETARPCIWVVESFQIKGDNPSQKNCQNELSHPGLSHTEQERQENLIQGKIHYKQNSNEGLKYS